MIQETLNFLSTALDGNFSLTITAALSWGILSILLSPCHLSSIPLVIGFIIQQDKNSMQRAFVLSLIFSSGILISIALIGVITASAGRLMGDLGLVGDIFVVIVFIVVGLYLMDILQFHWSIDLKTNKKGLIAALLLGLVFGIALGPCTFAFIAPVLGVAFTHARHDFAGALLIIFAFALGHCSVIVFFGTLANKVQQYLNWTAHNNTIVWIKRLCGVLVLLGGVYTAYWMV